MNAYRASLAATVAFGSMLVLVAPTVAFAAVTFDFNLAAQPLADSLRAVAIRAGVNVAFDPTVTWGRTAPTLSGSYSAEQALQRLAARCGLSIRATKAGTFLVEAPRGALQDHNQACSDRPRLHKVAFVQADPVPRSSAVSRATPQKQEATSQQGQDEIIVTAQRREERLVDVPISITALNEKLLDRSGVTTTLDLARLTPGLVMPILGAYLQPSIRGVTSTGAQAGESSNVALYVDGIYRPSQIGQLQDLPDVKQVDVLKGPQGTLFGQNAAGGAISVTTFEPSFEPSGRLTASYGNYNESACGGYVTFPLSRTVAAELAGSLQTNDGYGKDVLRNKHNLRLNAKLVRGKVLFEPSDRFSMTLGGFYSRRVDASPFAWQPLNGNALALGVAALYGLNPPTYKKPHDYATNYVPTNTVKTNGVNLRAELTTGIGKFSTVTSYSRVKFFQEADPDYTSVNFFHATAAGDHKDYIQEINFISEPIGRFQVAAGLFYMKINASNDTRFQTLDVPLTGPTIFPTPPVVTGTFPSIVKFKNRTMAAYLELTYHITDQLTAVVGGRYNNEHQSTSLGTVAGVFTPDPRNPIVFQKFTPRATLRYALGAKSNIYASFSQGSKSGIVNYSDLTQAPVKQESVTAYEVGYKGVVGPGINLSIAAFHYNEKNLQVFAYQPPVYVYQNAASARINGVEAQTSFNLAGGFSVDLGASYLDGKYKRFPKAAVFVPNANGLGNDQVTFDASGKRILRAPKFTGTLSLNYATELEYGKINAFTSLYYNSGYFFDANNRIKQPRHTTLNAEISYEPNFLPGVRVALYGSNLTNKTYYASILESQLGDNVYYADPRTWGGRIEFKF